MAAQANWEFFAPLLTNTHVGIIFYTGKDKLKQSEAEHLTCLGSHFVLQQGRPKFESLFERVIYLFEESQSSSEEVNNAALVKKRMMISKEKMASWCSLYCGGSKKLRDDLHKLSKKMGIGFESELFDW